MHKYGFHVNRTGEDVFDAIQRLKPKVIKTLEHNVGFWTRVRDMHPDLFLVGRLYVPNEEQDRFANDPAGTGRAFAERILALEASNATLRGRRLFDGWESYNEIMPESASPDLKRKYDDFQVAFAGPIKAAGFEPIAMNFATGNMLGPDFLNYFPGTLESYRYLGFHEYDWPDLWRVHEQNILEKNEGGMWLTLRYRRIMNAVRKVYGDRHRVLITECGMTQGVQGGNDVGPWDASFPIPEQRYWDSLAWYNSELQQDDYVRGACLFVVGAVPPWQSFEHLGGIVNRLEQLQQGQPPPVLTHPNLPTTPVVGPTEPVEPTQPPPVKPEPIKPPPVPPIQPPPKEGTTMQFPDDYRRRFLDQQRSNGQVSNDATPYDVRIAPANVAANATYWKLIGVHHLAPDENMRRHNAFVDVVDENGQRVRDPNLRIAWSWEGRQGDQAAPPKALDKPDNEPAGDVPIEKNMNLELWLEGDGLASDHVVNMHPRHPDENGSNGEAQNTIGHHSFYLLFQRTRNGITAPVVTNGGNGATDHPVTPPQPVASRPAFFPDYIYGLHEMGGEDLMVNAGRPGWVLELAAVGLDGGQPADFSALAQKKLGVVVRLNHGYGSSGTLPTRDHYDAFANACATYVARSAGCHVWIIGNEPNHEQERPDGQPITPDDYVQAYRLCRNKIRGLNGHAQDLVLVAGPAPWNIQTKYDRNPSGDWGKYFADTLALLGDGECDGFAVHTYTRAHDPSRIAQDIPFGNPDFRHLRDEFRTYRDWMERIPARFRTLPVLITESDPTDANGWEPAQNLGWIQSAYREIADWNRNPNNQPIQALILYRWPRRDDQPQWSLSNRPGLIDDWNAALRVEPANDYRLRISKENRLLIVPSERTLAPLPLIYTNQALINAFANAAGALGLASWALLEKAGLDVAILAADRTGLYGATPLESLPNLSVAERAVVRSELLNQLLKTPRWRGLVAAQDGLMLRSGPGTQNAVIKPLAHEAAVDVLAEQGTWLFVVADGDAGYVHSDFVIRPTVTAPTPQPVQGESATTLAPSADQLMVAPPNADANTVAVVNTWNRYGGLLAEQAKRLGIDPAIAVAVLVAESRGAAFGSDGRLIIRFEAHIFLHYCSDQSKARAEQCFRFDPTLTYREPRQQMWRRDPNGDWQICHTGQQADEWIVFDFARQIDDNAALMAISMGAPQVMGFNYATVGYPNVHAMFDAFRSSERSQIESLFRFMEVNGLVDSVRNKEFRAFAKGYNGSDQIDLYAGIIQERLALFEALRTPAPSAVPEALALPAPVAPVSADGKPLKESDPELYQAWADHIKQGFVNNNIMFNRILDGFMRPYQTTIWMYRILFGVGILAFLAAVVMALIKDQPAAAIGTSLVFGGLSVLAFLSYFVSRPMQALEENLQFITWLGIVYNTYWARLVNANDPATVQQELEDATTDAVTSIKEMLDKHAAFSRQRPGLTP